MLCSCSIITVKKYFILNLAYVWQCVRKRRLKILWQKKCLNISELLSDSSFSKYYSVVCYLSWTDTAKAATTKKIQLINVAKGRRYLFYYNNLPIKKSNSLTWYGEQKMILSEFAF